MNKLDLSTLKKGIDCGNGYTKVDGIRFMSAFMPGSAVDNLSLQKEVHAVSYGNERYIVGQGQNFVGAERFKTKAYKICVLTAIALSIEENHEPRNTLVDVCVGLPLSDHARYSQELAQLIKSWGRQEITVNNINYVISINSVVVFPEGASMLIEKNIPPYDVLTLDIGARTINCVLWREGRLVKSHTINKSLEYLYTTLLPFFNDEIGAGLLDSSQIAEYVNKNTMILDGCEVDITGKDTYIKNYIDGLESELRTQFPTIRNVGEIRVSGGGSTVLFKHIQSVFGYAKGVELPQYLNARIYKAALGEV